MRNLMGKVFLLGVSILAPIITNAVPVNNTVRRAKLMDFTADDLLQDMFDDVDDDPLPSGKIQSKDYGHKTNVTATARTKAPVIVTPMSSAKRKLNRTNQMRTNGFAVSMGSNETFVQTEKPEKFEIFTAPPDYFSYPMNFTYPVTQKTIVVYEGLDDEPEPSPVVIDQYGYNSTEQLKILWNSVGDAVEQVPFLPVHLNVPDLIAAMAQFLAAYLPFMNRITNINHPRDPLKTNKTRRAKPQIHYFENSDYLPLSHQSGTRREYRVRADGTLSKKRIKNKRKADKKKLGEKRNAQKKIFNLSSFTLRSTTAAPEDTKFFGLGNDQKETFKWKNMPITRKKIRVADKEIFNFKNSDINNSPIMILNVPQRPVTHFKVYHQIPIHQVPSSTDKNKETGQPSMPGLQLPNLPLPIPGLPIPGLPIPGFPGLGGLIPGLGGGGSSGPQQPSNQSNTSVSIPGIGGITIPGIGSINIGTPKPTGMEMKDNGTPSDEVMEGPVVKPPEKSGFKQRRKLKIKRRAKKTSKRSHRLEKVETDSKTNSTVTVP